MRRIGIVLVLLLALAIHPQARLDCSGSSPNWTSTADYASLSACVAGASAGDTITVTGNATWTTGQKLTFTRGLTFVGSGNPTIDTVEPVFYWTPDATAQAAHDTTTIRGFILDTNDSTAFAAQGLGTITVISSGAGYVTLVARGNTIRDIKASGRGIYINGWVRGAFASNTLDRVAIVWGNYNNDVVAWQNQTQAYGVVDNMYYEDNLIQFSSDMPAGYKGWIETGQGGRAVVRYNTWDFSNITMNDTLWDSHGLQSMQSDSGDMNCAYGPPYPTCNPTLRVCEQYSTMQVEYYGNKIQDYYAAQGMFSQRGGWALVFNNYYVANAGASFLNYAEFACDSCQSDGPTDYTQHIANTYLWNNFVPSRATTFGKVYDSCADYATGSPYTITANRDYFVDAGESFTGASGVGCGTLAARPATCTTGVGYWATNQSCSTMTGMVGASPSTPISGTLYKCTATNTWTSYYTPYDYPHPLVAVGVPTAPTNVRIR